MGWLQFLLQNIHRYSSPSLQPPTTSQFENAFVTLPLTNICLLQPILYHVHVSGQPYTHTHTHEGPRLCVMHFLCTRYIGQLGFELCVWFFHLYELFAWLLSPFPSLHPHFSLLKSLFAWRRFFGFGLGFGLGFFHPYKAHFSHFLYCFAWFCGVLWHQYICIHSFSRSSACNLLILYCYYYCVDNLMCMYRVLNAFISSYFVIFKKTRKEKKKASNQQLDIPNENAEVFSPESNRPSESMSNRPNVINSVL